MLSFHLSAIGRGAFSAVTGASLMVVAACSDETTAPRSVVVPDAPNAAILNRSLVTIHINTIWGTPLPEKATVEFVAIGGPNVVLVDNDPLDKNANVGVITLAVPWAPTYSVCLKQDAPSYAIDFSKPYCNVVPGYAKMVDAGALVMRKNPIAGFYMQDLAGNSIPGAKVTLTAPAPQIWAATAFDVNGVDLSATNDGKIVVKANRPGTYTWCEIAPPTFHALTAPQCGTIDLSWDLSTGIVLKHKRTAFTGSPG